MPDQGSDGPGLVSLSAKVVLITGATRGIGRAAAVVMAQRGASIAAVGRNRNDLESLADELSGFARCSIHLADVADVAAAERAVHDAASEHGGIDVIVNNAGMSAFAADIASATDEVWDRTLAVNLLSIRNFSRPAIPYLQQRGGGVIVNVSSVHAHATATGVAPYAASKGAVVALTRSMAIDLAPSLIRVVGILPGATDTPMLAEYSVKQGASLDELGFLRDPGAIGRVLEASEVGEAIAFVASPSASGITGTSIPVDGGLLARL